MALVLLEVFSSLDASVLGFAVVTVEPKELRGEGGNPAVSAGSWAGRAGLWRGAVGLGDTRLVVSIGFRLGSFVPEPLAWGGQQIWNNPQQGWVGRQREREREGN